MPEKRKGYSSNDLRKAADQRYYENNEGAKLKRIIRVCRSQAKKFIDNFATREELIELKEKIEEKLNE